MVVFVSLIIFNVCLVFALRPVANHLNLIDYPGGRKIHPHPTPLIGGLAIYFTLVAAVAIKNDWNSDIGMIISWAGAIVFIGCLDDIKNVRWPIRLCVQVIAAWGVVFTTGIEVTYLGTYPFIGPVELGPMSTAFTIFAVTALTNSFNLIDGIDGLCGSLLLILVSSLMAISYLLSGEVNFYLIIISAFLSVFLIFNLSKNPKRKIFMGDSGSAGLGFIVSILIIAHFNNHSLALSPPLAMWMSIIPISDTIQVIVGRTLKRKSIFQADLDHFHNRLISNGYSQGKTLTRLLLASFAGTGIGIFLNATSDIASLAVFLFTLIFIYRLLMLWK